MSEVIGGYDYYYGAAQSEIARLTAELATVKAARDRQTELLKLTGPYPHMCRNNHLQIGYAGEYREGDERCPLCCVLDDLTASRATVAELRGELATAEWLLRGARKMMQNSDGRPRVGMNSQCEATDSFLSRRTQPAATGDVG